jgi:phenol hydroxylase P0 protein
MAQAVQWSIKRLAQVHSGERQWLKSSYNIYVHIKNEKREGFVEFNFSINDPSLFLEMILPDDAFEDFCQLKSLTFLSPEQIEAVEKQLGGE